MFLHFARIHQQCVVIQLHYYQTGHAVGCSKRKTVHIHIFVPRDRCSDIRHEFTRHASTRPHYMPDLPTNFNARPAPFHSSSFCFGILVYGAVRVGRHGNLAMGRFHIFHHGCFTVQLTNALLEIWNFGVN